MRSEKIKKLKACLSQHRGSSTKIN